MGDRLQDRCGVVGIWNNDSFDTGEMVYLSLFGIQHRGQQTAGIAINDNGKIVYHREVGLVSEVFNEVVVKHLKGGVAGLGHVGYNVESEDSKESIQPLVIRYTKGQMALSYNGCLLNGHELRKELEEQGGMFQSGSDVEIIAQLLSRERVVCHNIEEALIQVMKKIRGAYSILIMTPNKIVAARDAKGMKPLCIGKLESSYVITSESCSLDTIGAEFVRDVIPGEIVVINSWGIKTVHTKKDEISALCIFEPIYLARTDSYIDGISVYETRVMAGKILAKEHPAIADFVVGVPDSGIASAIGYSRESGIPFTEGLAKNRYIGRTFIQPSQQIRERAVGLKLNALRSQISGKSIVLVDDTIVRGTTSLKIVQMLREIGGCKEVHVRISAPPVRFPCLYGIDTPDKDVLIANQMTIDQIRIKIGADSLGFLSHEGLLQTPVSARCSFCSACFDGKYPLE